MDEAAEPRWLTDEEQQTWIAMVSMLVRLPLALDAQLQRDAGITHVEYGVLAWLSMSPERTARMSSLAPVANTTLSHLSRITTRLEARGWVRRTPDPQDGRYTLAILTAAGWDKVVASAPGHVERVQSLVFDPLTKSQGRQLRDICRRILAATDTDECPPGPPAGC